MHPVLCSIGPLTFYSYGVMLAIAIVICSFLLSCDARIFQIPAEKIFDLVFWVAIGGIIGARIFYILLNWNYFVANPQEIVMVQHGGLAWQGSFIAGTVVGFWYIQKNRLPLLPLIDLCAPYIALGQSIGRIGCFLNGCCYGKPVSWGIYFPVHDAHLHPTQLYESLGLFFVFLFLRSLSLKNSRNPQAAVSGQVFVLYIVLASAMRFINEFFAVTMCDDICRLKYFSNCQPQYFLYGYAFLSIYCSKVRSFKQVIPTLMSEKILKVDEDSNQLRLDVFLTRQLTDVPSRTFIQKLIETEQVTVNGKKFKASQKVTTGDNILIDLPEQEDPMENIQPEKIPLDIFFEDEYLLVINKPIGMLVHPTHGCHTGTLVNALLHYCSTSEFKGNSKKKLSDVNAVFRPGIVHRLDRETSGLILVAKDNKTHVQLARQFERHQIRKRYVAVVKGTIEFEEGVIDAPLGRHPKYWDKKSVSFSELSKEATTFYQVLKRFEKNATLVALFPQSGRTHQLRVHMAYLGHPILGDEKYGMKGGLPRMGLHAQSIGFTHPASQSYVEFSSCIPAEFYSPQFPGQL